MRANGGLVTAADMARYKVQEREPVRGRYRGYKIVSMPPPSSGGTVLLEELNILEGYDLAGQGAAAPCFEFPSGLLGIGAGAAIGNGEVGAGCGQGERNLPPDAPRASGDQRGFAAKRLLDHS